MKQAALHADALELDNFTFHEASFEQLLTQELPGFDFIVLHGVYSWVGAKARARFARFCARSSIPAGSST